MTSDITKLLHGTTGRKEQLKRCVFRRFLQNSQWRWRRRRDVLRQCSTVGKRRWFMDGRVGRQAMMTSQSGGADRP